MKKTIKYLDNDGNYQYATVKDAGDLDKLKTKAKEDLVSAINELATNGIAASDIDEINNKVDQIQQQANQNADALNMSDQERQEMQQQIAQMQAEAQAKIAEMQKLAEEQNKKLQEASAELKKKADAIDVQKMQQDNAEALKNSAKALEDSLAATNEDLQKTADHLNEMEIQAGVVETSVKELQNGFESKVSSADFNEARTKLQEQETMVRQLNNELSTKASNNELDMVTQRVQKAESNIQQNAQGIKASVTKETMYKEMDDFAKYRENRLKYSRDFSNDWSLNGNDVIDDDHLFDTQHDVKSVSIRNGAYLTQTTDLDTDDMGKTFTLAMWVEKGKKPRAWYGSAELTNMKVKEDKGEYQRVYWTFVPTIVKRDIRITGNTSTQGNLIISEPKLEQSDRPSAWSTNTGDQYATTEKLAHDLKLTANKLESTITKQSEFSDRQRQDESRITQTEHGVEVANQTIVAKTDGLRQEFDGKISATSKSLTSEYQSFTNQAIGQMADGGSNLILNSSFGSLKNSYDKWTNVSPKVRIVEDDNGLKWAKMEQSGLTANSPIGLTSNLFRVKKGIVTVALDIRTDNPQAIDNDNIVILESYNADQKRVFTQEVGFSDFKITRETLFDHGPHRVTYKYSQTRDDTQYMAVHIVLPKNGVLYVTNVLARTVANGEDSGEYAPNAADLHEQVVQQRTRIEQNDQAIALKADQTKVTQDIDAAKSSLSGAISKVEQRAANLEVKADGITSSVSTLSKTIDGISVGGTNLLLNTKDFTGDWYQQGSASLQDLDGRKVIHAWVDWSSYRTRQVIQLEPNTDYTISADIRSLDGNSSDNTVTIYGFLDGKDTQLGDLHTNGKLSSKQQRFSAVWHNTSAGQLTTFRLEGHGGWGSVHGSIYISHIKLEKGNKPTDWSPAPEDTDSNISSLQSRASKLEQTDSEIKASVTSVTNDLKNGRGSIKEGILSMTDDHFSTKFSSIDNKIDGISVGGTNLLLNTKDFTGDWYQQGSASLQDLDGRKVIHAWVDWSSYRTRQVIQLEPNTDYTISADIRSLDGNSSDNTVTIYGFLDGKDTQLGDLHTNGKLSSKQQRFSAVWHNTSAGQLTTFRLEGHGGWGSVHGSIYISHIKLEKGNKPTDWSPAPEDTDSNISSLQSRASKLEQTDSEIKASVTSVTNDLKNGRGSIKEGILSMTDDHFSTKFSSIDNKIDGISVGGTNYMSHNLISAANSTLTYDANSGEWTAQIANGAGGTWGGGVQFNKSLMQVPWDHAYTDSIEVYVTDPKLYTNVDVNNYGVVNDSNLGGNDNDDRSLVTFRPRTGTEIPTNQWYKVSFTAWNKNGKNKNKTALWDQSVFFVKNNTGKTVTVKFRHPQQELGTMATDWSPASGDATSSGINILRNTTYPGGFVTFPAEWTTGQWRQASYGGSKKQRWDYNGSPIGNVKGYRVESGSESRDVTVAQDNVVISANTEYTMSVFARGSGQLFMQMGFEQTWISNSQTLSTDWTRYKFTFNSYSLTKANAYFGLKSANSWVDLIGFKLEQGNVATAWSPSPWDAQARIDGVVSKQAEFQTSIDGVKSTVSTLNNNQASFTKFEQTDGGFKLVAGQQTLEFGGTNLLKNSDFQQDWTNWSSHGSSSSISDSRPSGLPNYVKTVNFLSNTGSAQSALVQSHIGVKAGKDYMISFWAKADAATELCVESNAIRYQPKLTTSWQYYSGKVTFQTDDRELYIYPTSKTTWVHLAGIKLEQGNVATAWSPELVDKTTNLQKGLSTAQATIEQNSKSIALKVDTGKIINTINNSTEGIHISGNKIDIQSLKSSINLDKGAVKINGDIINLTTKNAQTLAGQINDNNSGITISGKHVSINGDTTISGKLDVSGVILQGKKGLIELNGNEGISFVDNRAQNGMLITPDKVQLRAANNTGGSVDITNSGVTIGMSYNNVDISNNKMAIKNTYSNNELWINDTQVNFTLNSNQRVEVLGGLRSSYTISNGDINGIHLVISTKQELGDPYGGDEFGIGRQIDKGASDLTYGMIDDDFVYNASGVGRSQGFHFYKSIYLEDINKKPLIFHGDNGSNGIWMNAYGNIEGGANSWAWKVRDAGNHLRLQVPMSEGKTGGDGAWMRFRDFTMDIEGAENKLKFTWWSNGGFYGGAKIPCLATENVFSGQGNDGSGIAFANGQYVYFTRNKWRSVGI